MEFSNPSSSSNNQFLNGSLKNIPQHVAIVMDGNGRWAQMKGLHRIEGHKKGVLVTEEIIEDALNMGIKYLTLYSFSKENWLRPQDEVKALMILLEAFLNEKLQKMRDKKIRFNTIGDISLMPENIQKVIQHVKNQTAHCDKMVLTLALSYGARDEILRAVKKAMLKAKNNFPEKFEEKDFVSFLDTADLPDPDLLIRTGGENRISNFLLWQLAYAEFVFEECYWPDFSNEHLMKALLEYQTRERRFGKTSEQLKR